ncbi:hypothetical protein GT039_37365 [Streptomyces sp. SID2955]|nr:hypothetical protein [Streptomyces sp. SID2955]
MQQLKADAAETTASHGPQRVAVIVAVIVAVVVAVVVAVIVVVRDTVTGTH